MQDFDHQPYYGILHQLPSQEPSFLGKEKKALGLPGEESPEPGFALLSLAGERFRASGFRGLGV